jgi:hypothetical protein
VHALLPHDAEVGGLIALMLLTERAPAGAHRISRRADSARGTEPRPVGSCVD